MKIFIILLICIFLMFIGAVSHEGDMARNFYKTGDAKAWFHKIRR